MKAIGGEVGVVDLPVDERQRCVSHERLNDHGEIVTRVVLAAVDHVEKVLMVERKPFRQGSTIGRTGEGRARARAIVKQTADVAAGVQFLHVAHVENENEIDECSREVFVHVIQRFLHVMRIVRGRVLIQIFAEDAQVISLRDEHPMQQERWRGTRSYADE